jgi:phosphonate transport system ATP-binding protein
MHEPLLDVRDLTVFWPKSTEPVLGGVSIGVRAGEFVAILGANGSGKTTLLKCIVRLISPTSGSIAVDGCEMADLAGPDLQCARRSVALITQNANLIERRSVLANVATGSLGRRREWWTSAGILPQAELDDAKIHLRTVGLEQLAAQRAGTLSGGQAQRVSIARALAQQPRVLLADEPVASLDPDAAEDVLRLLCRLARADGLAVLCVLHQPDLAIRYADRVVGLQNGRVAFDAAPGDISQAMLDSLYRSEAAA